MTNGNGNTKTLYWLLGILATALLTIGGAWAKDIVAKADKVPTIEQIQIRQQEQLDRMEGKLDKLLQQRGNR